MLRNTPAHHHVLKMQQQQDLLHTWQYSDQSAGMLLAEPTHGGCLLPASACYHAGHAAMGIPANVASDAADPEGCV